MRNLKDILTDAKKIMTEETFSDFTSLLRRKAKKGIISETVKEIDQILYELERVDSDIDPEFITLFNETEYAIKKYENFYEGDIREVEEHE